MNFTKDGSLAAYQISEAGADWRKVIVIDTKTKKQLDDTLTKVKFSGISWRGNDGFYYSSYESPKEGSQLSGKTQQHTLYYHKIGTKQSMDLIVFGGEKTPRRYISGNVTEDQHFLVISAANTTYGNELYIQDLARKDAPVIPVVTGFDSEQSVVWSENGNLYIITNLDAPNRKLIVTKAITPTPEHWKDLIAETKFPCTITTCGGKLFVKYTKDAVSEIVQYNLDGKREHVIDLPGLGTAEGFAGKKEEKEVYYIFTSYVYPVTLFKYDMNTGKSVVYKKPVIAFNSSDYESKQVFYTSKDGVKIPMIITFKKGMSLTGKNPLLLYGYGGFNISLTPAFSVSSLLLL